jgi:hypothetical protein
LRARSLFCLVSCKFLSLRGVWPCRPVTRPQGGLGAPSSPSRTRSHEPTDVGETLADDARTATLPRGAVESRVTSPPVVDSRVETPPRVFEAGGASAGDVGTTTSPTIIDVDPISAIPGGAEDLVRDQPQIDLAQEVQEHLACRYLNLRLQAQGCHGGQLTGITPLGRRTSLKITRTCRPCRPASLPSIPH